MRIISILNLSKNKKNYLIRTFVKNISFVIIHSAGSIPLSSSVLTHLCFRLVTSVGDILQQSETERRHFVKALHCKLHTHLHNWTHCFWREKLSTYSKERQGDGTKQLDKIIFGKHKSTIHLASSDKCFGRGSMYVYFPNLNEYTIAQQLKNTILFITFKL